MALTLVPELPHYLSAMYSLRTLYLLPAMVGLCTPMHAQPALAQVQAQFGTARDSLILLDIQVQAQQSKMLASMRARRCDSTALWPLAERCMQLRIQLRAPLDSLLALNARQLAVRPDQALFMDLSVMDEGTRIHGRISSIMEELKLICPDALCREAVQQRHVAIFRDEKPDVWGLSSFYAVAPFALEPVLLSYTVHLERAVFDVLHGLQPHCPD